MRYSILLLIMVINFNPSIGMAQCDCPPLPNDHGTIYNVNSVSELWSALESVDESNGNATIILEPGTYLLANRFIHISSNMPNVTVRGSTGNRDDIIIKGEGYNGSTPHAFLVAASNFILADLTLGWVKYHGVQIQGENDADNPLIQNVRFVNTREQMLKVSGRITSESSNNGIVQCCLFEFPDGIAYQYYTGGVDAHNATDWIIRNNTFKHIRSPESNLAEHAVHFWSNSKNTLVENNTIINCDRGIGFGLGSSPHEGGVIQNNFVHTSRDVGIGLESATSVKVYNNTVITDNYFNSIEYRFTATTDAHIVNNLTNKNVASRQGGEGVLANNYTTSDTDIFEDAANHNYHLTTNAVDIIDAGMIIPQLEYDFDCHLRIAGLNIDIGADEYQSFTTSFDKNTPQEAIQVYPNPSQGEIKMLSQQPGIIKIYDQVGRLIVMKKIKKGENHFFVKHKGMIIYKYITKLGYTVTSSLVLI